MEKLVHEIFETKINQIAVNMHNLVNQNLATFPIINIDCALFRNLISAVHVPLYSLATSEIINLTKFPF